MSARETKTVLYVEDNSTNVLLVQAIFEAHADVRLLTAAQGGAGLEIARKCQPDLILLDLNLPDMDGEEYLEKLRTAEATTQIPVVIISAEAMNLQRARFIELGVADYITKPFNIDQFDEIVNRCLGRFGPDS